MKSLREYFREGNSDGDTFMAKVDNAPSGERIFKACMALCEFLLDKNTAYGDSALHPVRIFSKSSPEDQIRVRLDDKINRLMKGSDAGEDTTGDFLGYLVLLLICEERGGPLPDRRREDGDRGLRARSDLGERGDRPAPDEAPSPPESRVEREPARGDRGDDPAAVTQVATGVELGDKTLTPRQQAEHDARLEKARAPVRGLCQDCNAPTAGVVCEACATRKGFHRFTDKPVERSSEVSLQKE